MSNFPNSPGDSLRRRGGRPGSDPYAPTEQLAAPASGSAQRLSFAGNRRRTPALAAVLGAVVLLVAIGGYALLSAGGPPKRSANAVTQKPSPPSPANAPQSKPAAPAAASGSKTAKNDKQSANGGSPSPSHVAGTSGAGSGGSHPASSSAGGSPATASGSGGGSGGSASDNMLGPTPSVSSPRGQRLLRESPDCRNVPPPPPGYNGPVQC